MDNGNLRDDISGMSRSMIENPMDHSYISNNIMNASVISTVSKYDVNGNRIPKQKYDENGKRIHRHHNRDKDGNKIKTKREDNRKSMNASMISDVSAITAYDANGNRLHRAKFDENGKRIHRHH